MPEALRWKDGGQCLELLVSLSSLYNACLTPHTSGLRYKRHASREEAELVQQMGANIKERQNVFFDMEAYLPKKNG